MIADWLTTSTKQEVRSMCRFTSVRRTALVLALAVSMAGCVSFGAKPPPSLLTLTPAVVAKPGAQAKGSLDSAVAIADLNVPARLSNNRVPVQVDDANIAYLKDAVWVDKPNRLFRQLITETIRAKSDRIVINNEETSVPPAQLLSGTLDQFGYDARSRSVIVRFDAILRSHGAAVETRRFESVIPGVSAKAGPVSAALNQAANDVAQQVADWVG